MSAIRFPSLCVLLAGASSLFALPPWVGTWTDSTVTVWIRRSVPAQEGSCLTGSVQFGQLARKIYAIAEPQEFYGCGRTTNQVSIGLRSEKWKELMVRDADLIYDEKADSVILNVRGMSGMKQMRMSIPLRREKAEKAK